jgi:hypothetical protein
VSEALSFGDPSGQHIPTPPQGYRTGERRGIYRIAKPQPPGEKTHICMALDVLVPPSGICARRQQADDQGAAFRFLPGFSNPQSDLA